MSVAVLLIAFNRPEHTKKTLDALLVQHPTELYVYADGPREGNVADLDNCAKVKNVIDELLKNEKNIVVHKEYSTRNRGCREAVIHAINWVLEEHEEIIVVEDDIVTSPTFLSYMNKALAYYKDRKGVFSISGWSPSPSKFKVRKDYAYDVYCAPRQFSWGWGTWRDRWQQVDWTMGYYEDLLKHSAEVEAWSRGGDDLLPMLIDEREGRSSAWDIQFAYTHFRNNGVSIVPCESYTQNIGLDGSGTHCSAVVGEKDDVDLCKKKNPRLLDNLYYDKEIQNSLYSAYCGEKRVWWQRCVNALARLLGCKVPFTIKKKIYA